MGLKRKDSVSCDLSGEKRESSFSWDPLLKRTFQISEYSFNILKNEMIEKDLKKELKTNLKKKISKKTNKRILFPSCGSICGFNALFDSKDVNWENVNNVFCKKGGSLK